MLTINVICIGKVKEKFFRDAIDEYSKRLSKYCKLNILELPDEKIPDKTNLNIENEIKTKECNNIINHIKKDSYVICLDLKGKELLNHYVAFLGTAYGIGEYENKINTLFRDFEPSEPTDPSQQTIRSQLRKQRYIENLKAQINGLNVKKAKNAIDKMTADYNSDVSTIKMLIDSLNKAYSKVD